jgi:hypothetical protein
MSRTTRVVFGLAVLFLLGWLLFPCIQKVRDSEGWVRSAVTLERIGEALRSYHDTYGQLPGPAILSKEGKPLLSWRVAILPFIEQAPLYNKFKLDEPWDSPHNKALLETTPECFEPALGGLDAPGLTRYQVFVGPGTAFERPGLTFKDFSDGLENTFLVVEAAAAVPWSKPTLTWFTFWTALCRPWGARSPSRFTSSVAR